MVEMADLLEEAVAAAQEVHRARHGQYHPAPWKLLDVEQPWPRAVALLDALEIQEQGVLALGGPYADEWDEEMFKAAERVFRSSAQ